MGRAAKTGRAVQIALLVTGILLALVSGAALFHFNLISLSSTSIAPCSGSNFQPAAQIVFNPCGSTLSYKSYGSSTSITGSQLYSGYAGSTWTDTSINWPIGAYSSSFNVRYCNVFNVCTPSEAWIARLPATTTGYTASFGVSGPQLINTATQQCGGTAPASAQQDCIVYPAGNSTIAPPICQQGGCYQIPNTYTAYKTNATGTYKATVSAAYWVYRFIFSVTIIVNVSTSSVSVSCDTSFPNNQCPSNSLCLPGSLFGLGCTDPSGFLTSNLNNFVVTANANAHLTSSQISLQLNTPLNAITSNQDWYGIYGAWIGGQGPQNSGSCTTGTSCSTGIGAHSVLGIYKDPNLSMGAYPTNTTQWTSFLPSYGLSNLQAVLPQNLHNTVYLSIPLYDYGATFAVSSSCNANTLNSCFTASPSITTTIPIVYDVMGSKTPFFGSLQWIQTQTNCFCQTVYGRTLDGNSPFGLFGFYNPLPGALACVGTCPTTASQSQASLTNSTGWFVLYNIALPTGGSQTVNIYIQDFGYNNIQVQPSVSPAGGPVNIGTYVMQPTAANQICLLPPVPNPVPGQPPLFAGVCLPTWEVVAIFIFAFGLIALTIFLVVPSTRKFSLGAGVVRGSI